MKYHVYVYTNYFISSSPKPPEVEQSNHFTFEETEAWTPYCLTLKLLLFLLLVVPNFQSASHQG